MSSLIADPGVEIAAEVSGAPVVPEVLAVKNQIGRRARLGRPAPPPSGEATEIVHLLDAFKKVTEWWTTPSSNPLLNAYRSARNRRKITFCPYTIRDGVRVPQSSKGRSAAEEVLAAKSITLEDGAHVVTVELCYSEVSTRGSGIMLVPTVTPLTIGCDVDLLDQIPDHLRFAVKGAGVAGLSEVVLHIYGVEERELLSASGLTAAPAQMNETIVIKLS
jgi:hypothetical protein